jgi:hypothetical protein
VVRDGVPVAGEPGQLIGWVTSAAPRGGGNGAAGATALCAVEALWEQWCVLARWRDRQTDRQTAAEALWEQWCVLAR